METASTPETMAVFDQTTRRNNPEDSHLHKINKLGFGFQVSDLFTTGITSNIALLFFLLSAN
jgi:hypothetical protein